nr:alpha/beta fold hydrolase [Paenibacillus turpanensis]
MWTAVGIVITAIIACLGISVYVGLTLTHPEKKPITQTPAELGLPFADQVFTSADGSTSLKGWVIEPENPKLTVIMSHGYRGNRVEKNLPFLPIAKSFHDAGYRVLLFDFRYNGESGGSMTTIGAKEKLDLLGVIGWAKQNHDEPIVLYGISMGAATSILAAGLSPDVSAVLADSPYSDLESYLKTNLSVWSKLPEFPFTPLIMALIPKVTELDPKEASPMAELDKIYPRPVLFVHGRNDAYIPSAESEKMAAAHPDRFQLWVTENQGHVQSYKHHSEEYMKRAIEFFKAFEKQPGQ